MEENKVDSFWETENQLRKILLFINDQLETTRHDLSAQMPKLQELFLKFTQLGEELGFNVDSLDVKKFYDGIQSSGLLQKNNLFRNDTGAEKAGIQQEMCNQRRV